MTSNQIEEEKNDMFGRNDQWCFNQIKHFILINK